MHREHGVARNHSIDSRNDQHSQNSLCHTTKGGANLLMLTPRFAEVLQSIPDCNISSLVTILWSDDEVEVVENEPKVNGLSGPFLESC